MKKDLIPFPTVASVDIRVGEVVTCEEVAESRKMLRLTVDFGVDYGTVTIFTGLKPWHAPDAFVGNKFLFVANLQPKPMLGAASEGMILAGDGQDSPILIPVNSEIPNGTPVI